DVLLVIYLTSLRKRTSRTGYIKSTITLILMYAVAVMTTTAKSSGVSRLATACTDILPRPAQRKTDSVTTETPTTSPQSRPTIVSSGKMALRSTLRQKIQASDAPLARTTCTKDSWLTSSIERMSTWISGAAMGTTKVSVGRMRPSIAPGLMAETQPRRK